MKTTVPNDSTVVHIPYRMFNLLRAVFTTIAIWILMVVSTVAAPPTAEDDAKIVGNWHVSPPNLERVYEISTGHNVRIVGGNLKEKFGRLTPQKDGSYTMNLEGGAVQKIVFVAASDQLSIEYYNTKKDFELGLVAWKRPGTRMPAK